MNIENIFIGNIYQLTNKNELLKDYEAVLIKETILYRKGYIETTYLDLKTLKIYPSDYSKIKIGEYFINEQELKPYIEIISDIEKKQEQSVRYVRAKYRKYKEKKN